MALPEPSRPVSSILRHASRGALICLAPALLAAQGNRTGVVAGRITARVDSGAPAPLPGATITVEGAGTPATSADDGRYLLERVPAGTRTLRVRLAGFRAAERSVRVSAGDTARVDVTLLTDAQLLTPVRTSARAADLEIFLSKPNVAAITMSAAAMAGVPSVGEPDVVRVVQLLPGVISRNDFNTGLTVRGGEADQNLILLDGHPIYNPFHLGGLFSTFMDATVGGVDLLTGAFPARYGGRLSSVLDVRSADETRPGIHASADISALATSARIGGAFGAGRGTWSIAGRRTYADALARVFTDNIFPYHFRDFHGRTAYLLPGDVRLAVTGYAGKDVLDANLAEFETDSVATKAGRGEWAFDWGNRVLGVSLAKDFGPGARLPLLGLSLGDSATVEQRFSTSGFSTRLDLGGGAFAQRSEIRDFRVSGSLLVHGGAHERSVGYDVATHRIRYASASEQAGTIDFDFVQRPVSAAVWVGDLRRLSPRWIVEGGLRAEALTGRQWAALSPRGSVKFLATPTLALTAAAGRSTQWLHSLAGDGPLRYFDIWIASDSFTPVATAWHYVAGIERRFDAGSVRVEGYLKQYDRVSEANWQEDPARRGDEFFQAQGESYGVDVHARWQRASGAAGWISYSFGRSRRWRDTVQWAPGHDREHDLDVVATWHLRRYRMGARFGFATGTPYTPIVGQIVRRIYDPSLDRWGTGDPILYREPMGGARNSARFPATHRLDFDVSREFLRRGVTYSPYVSVANAYNAQNVFVYLYDYSTDSPTRRGITQFPILPSAGVRIAF
jgi:hypothetical protein